MNDRLRAIEILRQAREVLLARLTERVVDGREDLLDDAAGLNYSGAIENVHDQLGQRLGNIAALLAHLQSADDAPNSFEISANADHEDGVPHEFPRADCPTESDRVEAERDGCPLDESCRELVVQEAVFHETDFRELDKIARDIEGSLVNAGDGRSEESSNGQ